MLGTEWCLHCMQMEHYEHFSFALAGRPPTHALIFNFHTSPCHGRSPILERVLQHHRLAVADQVVATYRSVKLGRKEVRFAFRLLRPSVLLLHLYLFLTDGFIILILPPTPVAARVRIACCSKQGRR